MKKDNIFGLVAMGCGLLLIICVFLPYISYFSNSVSLWKAEDSSRFIYILLGLLVIVLYLINKKTEMSYLTAGYGAFTSIASIISIEGLDGLSIGFYLILLSSIAIGVMTFLYDESKVTPFIKLSVSVNKPVMNNAPMNYNQPMSNQQPISQPVQPQVQPIQQNISYDPMTGQPIYPNQNNN